MAQLSAKEPKVEFDVSGASDIGRKRESNQDQYLIAELYKSMQIGQSSFQFDKEIISGDPMGTLMFVADGIGGGPAGDIASRMAIEEVCRFVLNSMHWLHAEDPSPSERFVKDLVSAIDQSHRVVRDNADQNLDRIGMGTTLTLAYIVWPHLYVVHVGDSRCYLLEQGELTRITTDQTVAQSLLDKGLLTPEEMEKSRFNNMLWSCIGAAEDPTAVIYQKRLSLGDAVLLCSDGVTRYLEDEQLHSLMTSSQSCREICESVVEKCNAAGGADNITIVMTRCFEPSR